jgi:hypothetical protein
MFLPPFFPSFLFFFFFLTELGIELRTLSLLGRHSHSSHTPSPFPFVFQIGSCAFAQAGLGLRSSFFHLLSSCDYRCAPLHPAQTNMNFILIIIFAFPGTDSLTYDGSTYFFVIL